MAGDAGKARGVIQFANGQKPCVGGDGGAVEFQADFGVEIEPR